MTKKPIIWSISGSDCSGGAGIAADIKTGHGLGVEVCTLITANTVQNSHQLISINPTSIDILQQQFDTLLHDKPPTAIKLGLIATLEQATWLVTIIKQLKEQSPELIVVYDPVGQASVGGNFNTLSIQDLVPLLTQVDVITPNLIEAKTLAKAHLLKDDNVNSLAESIYQSYGINSIIIKGGHSDDSDQCLDFCYHQLNQIKQDNQDKLHQVIRYQLTSPRIATHYSHGGGCSYATALTAFLVLGYLIRDAFTLTKAFINQGLNATKAVSTHENHQYYGAFEQEHSPFDSIDAVKYFPKVVDEINQKNSHLPPFNSLNLQGEKLGLYPVIDSIEWLKRLLPLGLKIIQLRVKNLVHSELEQVIIEAINLAKNSNTRLFINDYWQLAIKHGAYGVHIGQEDLLEADLAKIQLAGVRLGISTHGSYEFLLAQQLQPSYLAIGAIFPTKTKDMTGQIQGIDNLQQLLTLMPAKPKQAISVVAIGGINFERAPEVLATGVDSIAVVTAITKASNPEQAATKLANLTTLY